MNHLVLLGDSILDNAAYVPGRPAVVDQVRHRLPADWRVTLSARDGSVINEITDQLTHLPDDATHLVVSAGGNDVLGEIGLLQEPVRTVGDGLRLLAEVRDRFERDYHALLAAICKRGLPTVLCTIYDPCSPDEELQREAVAALGLFNDRIISLAREYRFPVIELRAICTATADFANAIEPSSSGGAKIAEAICAVVTRHDFGERHAVLYP
jgi:hypothetical protein